MNKENTDKLLKEFPSLYKQYYRDMKNTCMCWGFDIDDGWFDLVYNLSVELMKVNPECEACQVKEKFGGLRFYADHANEKGFELISSAEERSFSICESCGKKGKLIEKNGWYTTKCKSCLKK